MRQPSRQIFPTTRWTWLGERLAGGQTGHLEALRHVMEVYAWPLQVYVRGTSWRRSADPAGVVRGFLADRLGQPGYLDGWRASGKPLRRWLANGLSFYLQERHRAASRESDAGDLPPDLASPEPAPLEALDRAFAVTITRLAMERAAARCRAEGLEQHWDLFVRHHYEGMSYRELAATTGLRPERAAVMVRTATKRFRALLRELLEQDGVPPERVERAIADLLAAATP